MAKYLSNAMTHSVPMEAVTLNTSMHIHRVQAMWPSCHELLRNFVAPMGITTLPEKKKNVLFFVITMFVRINLIITILLILIYYFFYVKTSSSPWV